MPGHGAMLRVFKAAEAVDCATDCDACETPFRHRLAAGSLEKFFHAPSSLLDRTPDSLHPSVTVVMTDSLLWDYAAILPPFTCFRLLSLVFMRFSFL